MILLNFGSTTLKVVSPLQKDHLFKKENNWFEYGQLGPRSYGNPIPGATYRLEHAKEIWTADFPEDTTDANDEARMTRPP